MATERQIQANRANAQKFTAPTTPEGKRVSTQNGVLHSLVSGTLVFKEVLKEALKGESMRFNTPAAVLAQTMTAARWRLLRTWGIQTAGFQQEVAPTAKSSPSAGTGAILAAATFRSLADNSRAAYDRQDNHALAMLLKLCESPDHSARPVSPLNSPPKPGRTIFKANPIFPPNLKQILLVNE